VLRQRERGAKAAAGNPSYRQRARCPGADAGSGSWHSGGEVIRSSGGESEDIGAREQGRRCSEADKRGRWSLKRWITMDAPDEATY
jgi:hypothetical protein